MDLTAERAFADEDVRQMVLHLAHKVRNPLATIKSAAQLLEHLQRPQGEVAEYYACILAEVTRIDRVMRDMEVLIRLDPQAAGEARLEVVIASAVGVQEAAARARSTLIDNAGGPEATALADHAQLEYAVRELIDNAILVSPPSSVVRIRWRLLEPSRVAVEVEDQGPGVSSDLAGRFMRPFFSTSTQGTGLGLNIVARTAAIAGGELRWTNLDAGGARFSLVLPRK